MLATDQPPSSEVDLWTEASRLDPYDDWRTLREAGPVVYLPKYDLYALARYQDVRDALANPEVFTSTQGTAMNQQVNEMFRGKVTLNTDGAEHDQLRSVLRKPLVAKELRALEIEIGAEADALIARLIEQGSFDAATELAQYLPLTVVSERVGLPEDGRENMLDWAAAVFNCIGPMNELARGALPKLEEAVQYSFDPSLPQRLKPGGWASRLWEAADRGEVPHERCPAMLIDYWGPSLDTTIFAAASAIWLFGEHPEQWDLVREDPGLIPHAVNEVLRLETPISFFSRQTTREHAVDGVTLPARAQVMVMYGSANRDERKWDHPERFDVARKPTDHLGFGYGEHNCVGQGLARLELKALLGALVKSVERFELGHMERAVNNVLRGIRRLEVTVR